TFQLFSQQDESGREWTLHATGTVGGRIGGDAPPLALLDIQARCQEADVAAYYEQLAGRGLHLGRTFQGMQRLWRGAGEALGRIALSGTDSSHPAFLDACLQPLAAAMPGDENYLLIGLEQLQVGALPAVVWSHARLMDTEAGETMNGNVVLYDETGRAVGQARGVLLKRAGRGAIQRLLSTTAGRTGWLYDVTWQPQPPALAVTPPTAHGQWLLFSTED